MFDIDFSRFLSVFTYDPANPMIFSTGIFLWLFLGFTLVYWLLSSRAKTDTPRILFVTLFSYYFYYKSSGFYFGLLALVTFTDFYLARALSQCEPKSLAARILVALSVLIDLSLLGYFKYTNFLGSLFMADWHHLDIFLPVGVSFFTFQSLSYTIDVYRGNIQPLSRFLDYAFYVSFFPQLVAGPIVRARDFLPQIHQPLVVTNQMFGEGIFLILSGLFKKAVISDYISVNFVERIFDQPTLYSGLENLLGVYGYTLQIYCDFSGYSDMAIGIALLLGFRFPQNFNAPYKSTSITEFWRRWHISLSSWLKDYLYISLGGNRHGKLRQYLNLLITMLLGGLWHGASLNFVLWGGVHGVLLALDKVWYSLFPNLSPLRFLVKSEKLKVKNLSYAESAAASFVSVDTRNQDFSLFTFIFSLKALYALLTFHLVAACWVLFRASDFQIARDVFVQIFTNFHADVFAQWLTSYGGVAFLLLLGYVLHFLPQSWSNTTRSIIIRLPLPLQALLIVLVIWIVIQVKSADVQPFIYFQF